MRIKNHKEGMWEDCVTPAGVNHVSEYKNSFKIIHLSRYMSERGQQAFLLGMQPINTICQRQYINCKSNNFVCVSITTNF
jgi:hypothetical protein